MATDLRFADHPTTSALVIGGSLAGMCAARVLSDFVDRVAIIERDAYPSAPDFRPGVPQARHVSDHGVEGTSRAVSCVIQLRSGFSSLNRHDTASTSMGNGGRPRMRQV